MNKVRLREMRPADWRLYRELRLRALADSPSAFPPSFDEEAAQPDVFWANRLQGGAGALNFPLIAEVGGEAVAIAWGRIDCANPSDAELFHVWVAPEHRSLGIGRRIVTEVVEWAKRAGATRLWLFVTCGNAPARRLYEGLGFKAASEILPLRDGSTLLMQRMDLALVPDTASATFV